MLPSKLPILRISRSEDPYDASCALSSALVCPHVLSRAAVFPLLAPSWPCPVGSSQAHPAPPPPQAALPTRLPGLSPRLHSLANCGASASACAPLARGQKPPGSPEAGEHRGLRLSEPQVPLLRHH